jgi:hypothetical protein
MTTQTPFRMPCDFAILQMSCDSCECDLYEHDSISAIPSRCNSLRCEPYSMPTKPAPELDPDSEALANGHEGIHPLLPGPPPHPRGDVNLQKSESDRDHHSEMMRYEPNAQSIQVPPQRRAENPFFATAQHHRAAVSAPYVWAATTTNSASAERQSSGMVQKAKRDETNKDVWSAAKALPCASIGSSLAVAHPPLISKTTDAQDAEKSTTVLSLVLAERRTRGLTSYKHASWSKQLSKHNLLEKYPDLVEGITCGFILGIPSINRTHTPNNHPSIALYHDADEAHGVLPM